MTDKKMAQSFSTLLSGKPAENEKKEKKRAYSIRIPESYHAFIRSYQLDKMQETGERYFDSQVIIDALDALREKIGK